VKNGFKVFVIGELLAFCGAFYAYTQLNKSRDFRFWMHERLPSGLEFYYRVGEFMNYEQYKFIRQVDNETWGINKETKQWLHSMSWVKGVQSVAYLVGFTLLGYGLLGLSTKSEEEFKRELAKNRPVLAPEEYIKRRKLQEAIHNQEKILSRPAKAD